MKMKWLFIAMGLIVVAITWHFNLPTSITAGSSTDVAVFIFLIGCGIFAGSLSLASAERITKNGDGTFFSQSEKSGWHLPTFLKDNNSYEANKAKRREKISNYRDRAHSAIFSARRRDRNGRYIS